MKDGTELGAGGQLTPPQFLINQAKAKAKAKAEMELPLISFWPRGDDATGGVSGGVATGTKCALCLQPLFLQRMDCKGGLGNVWGLLGGLANTRRGGAGQNLYLPDPQ